jgi:hypothetical protein
MQRIVLVVAVAILIGVSASDISNWIQTGGGLIHHTCFYEVPAGVIVNDHFTTKMRSHHCRDYVPSYESG